MRKLSVFNSVSVDGYFTDEKNDIGWAHREDDDPEWGAFVTGNAKAGGAGGGELLFGRKTYEMMAGYWPTPEAKKGNAAVAESMNRMPKVVVSRTLDQPKWENTRLVKDDLVAEVRKMKAGPGEGITIMGSGSIVAQLSQAGLIDEFQIVVVPIVLGKGRTMFEGLQHPVNMQATHTRAFANGNVYTRYEVTKVG